MLLHELSIFFKTLKLRTESQGNPKNFRKRKIGTIARSEEGKNPKGILGSFSKHVFARAMR
jgi:hypothetical protein